MIGAASGLTVLSTDELKKLLSLLHKGHLTAPVTTESLTCIGFQYRNEVLMGHFRGVDTSGIRATLVAVIAERLNH